MIENVLPDPALVLELQTFISDTVTSPGSVSTDVGARQWLPLLQVAVALLASMLQSLRLWSSEHSITDCPFILHVPVYLQCNKCSNEQRAKIQFGSKEDLQNNNMNVAVSVCKCCRSSIVADSTTLYWKDN